MIILFILFLFTLAGSISFLIWGDGDNHPYHNTSWYGVLILATVIGLLIIVPMQLGGVARYEIPPTPWGVFEQTVERHGLGDAWLSVLGNIIFLLWIYVVPARLYVLKLARGGNPAKWPYVVNVLVGLVLSTPQNPIYKILDMFVN